MQPNLDTPVGEVIEEPVVQDTPIENPDWSPISQEENDFLAIQSSFMANYLNGTPVATNFMEYSREANPKATAERLAAEKAEADQEDLQEAFVLNPAGESGDIAQEIQLLQDLSTQMAGRSSDVDIQFTEAASGPDGSLENAAYEAGKIKMWKMLSGWQQEVSGVDKVFEIGKVFTVPFLESIRGAKVTGNYFGAKEEFQAMIRAFRRQPIEDQVAMLPALRNELVDKVGNVDSISLLASFLDPMGDVDFDRYGGSEVVWDALDATGVGYGLSMVFKGIKGGTNTVRILKDLKNHKAAEEAAAVSLVDPNIARSLGVDELTAASNALPYDTSVEVIGRVGGISNKVLANLDNYFKKADQVAEDIINSEGYLREQTVSNKYRKQLEDAAYAKFQTEKAENIRIVEKDSTGTTFEYQVLDEEGNLTDEVFRLSLDMNSAGTFEQSTMGLIREYIGSPSTFARGMLREDVKTAERVDYLTSRINRQLTDLTKEALKPIGLLPTAKNKASLARVDKALVEGDEWKNADGTRGIVFTPDELRIKFGLENDSEISAYYRVNRLYNNLWNIRNNEKRAEMNILGYRNVNFSRSGDSSFGKTYENALTARASLNKNSIHQIYDSELDEVLDFRSIESDYMAQAYKEGKVMVRMDTPYDIGGDRGIYRYALVPAEDVGDLPSQVLHRKTGYVPRIYEDATHFVKERVTRTVDGDKEFKSNVTLRFFDNKKDSEKYIDDLVKKDVNKKLEGMAKTGEGIEDLAKTRKTLEKEARDKYVSLTDREEEVLAAASGEVSHGSNGLYTGARAQDDILFGLEGSRANRVNSFESLIRNIGNVSRYTAMNQWRLGLEQRWINTANEIFKSKGLDTRIEKFERLPKTSEGSPEVRFLNRTFDQIRDWQNFPTPEEQFFSNLVRGLQDFTSEKDMKKTAKMLGNFRNSDPVAAARATAFHSLLGMFNPAHFWIQAQGGATALSLGFGKYMTQTLRNTSALTMMGYGAKDATRYSRVAKANLMDAEELESMHKLWLKTGYEDSVLQTADHAAAAKGYGMTTAVLKSIADKGLLFYRQGEFMNRRMAFTTALERWKEKNKVKTVRGIKDDQLKDIMDDANAIMLGMSKANRASWQKGLPSLPTQFLQVTTKSIETMTGLNQNFDRTERARLLLGQLALYGTAGIPLVSLPYMLATEVFGMTQQDIEQNPKLFKALNDGFWGVTTMHLFGVDAEISSRGSLLKGISDFVDNWFIQESSVAEKFLGAFGSTGQRFWDDFTEKLRPFTLGNMSDIDFSDVGKLLVSPVFSSMSSYNNFEKAYIMDRLDAAYSNSGKLVAKGFSFSDAVAQAIGFQPTAVTDTYDLQARVRFLKDLPQKITSDILKEFNKFAAAHPTGNYTEEEWEEHKTNISLMYGWLDPDHQLQVRKAVSRELSGNSVKARATQQYVELMKNNTADDMSVWMKTLIGSKAIRLGIIAEEE